MAPRQKPRLVELYAGLGGVSTAWPEAVGLAAYDINQNARRLFEANYSTPYWIREIESLPIEQITDHQADLWWLSPPCQPFTRKGAQRASDDSRSKSFARWLSGVASCAPDIACCMPSHIVVENVVGFEESEMAKRFEQVLQAHDYRVRVVKCCPTDWGWPNRRPRVYALATRMTYQQPIQLRFDLRPKEFLVGPGESTGCEAAIESSLLLEESIAEQYAEALDTIEMDSGRPTACFTSSYGQSWLRSGSYLSLEPGAVGGSMMKKRLRYFSPREVANFLGFPDTFDFAGLGNRTLWKLLGNSLSLPAVRFVLSHFENGPRTELPWWPK
ncbi:MAG: DNA cytosine methyltransferase [Aureliella sp.]